jgi:hypothetical protein
VLSIEEGRAADRHRSEPRPTWRETFAIVVAAREHAIAPIPKPSRNNRNGRQTHQAEPAVLQNVHGPDGIRPVPFERSEYSYHLTLPQAFTLVLLAVKVRRDINTRHVHG